MRWSTRATAGWWVAGRGALVAGAAGLGWLAALSMPRASGQAGTPPAPVAASAVEEIEEPVPDPTGERAAMRERMVRRIFELRSRAEMFQQATAKLDEGASVEAVRAFVRERGTIVGRLLGDADAPREVDRLEGRAPGEGPRRLPIDDGRGGGRSWRERAQAGEPLTGEEREVLRDMMLTTDPELWAGLQKMRLEKPAEADRRLRRLLPVAGIMIELRRRDPALYQLRLEQMKYERQVLRVVGRIVDAEAAPEPDTEAIAALHAELSEAGGRAFDMRIAVQAHELAQLQGRLDTVRKDIEEQESQRDQLIKHHVERMLEGTRRKRHADRHGGPRHDMERPPAKRPRPGGERPRRRD